MLTHTLANNQRRERERERETGNIKRETHRQTARERERVGGVRTGEKIKVPACIMHSCRYEDEGISFDFHCKKNNSGKRVII